MSSKLVFYYGTVNSSKSMVLLSIAHNYDACGKKVVTIKPSLDTRSQKIETRAGVPPRVPDIFLKENESLTNYQSIINSADVILVDECQFMTTSQVEELRDITIRKGINILCFGLRTDYNTKLFDASKRLFELADEIIEVKTICSVCGKHASFNAKVIVGHDGQRILPGWDSFEQRCYSHYIGNE